MNPNEMIIKLEKIKQAFQDDFLFAREEIMRAEIKTENRLAGLQKEIDDEINLSLENTHKEATHGMERSGK